MSDAVYDTTEGEFVDFATLEEWATIDKSKDARIEALIAERDQAWKRAGHAEKMWGELEVKLAKAVAFLQDQTGAEWPYDEDAKRILAELTGGKDD